MSRLDRSRPYTQVYGVADYAFGQDGKKFDLDGNEIGSQPFIKAKAAEKPAKTEPDQVDAQLNA